MKFGFTPEAEILNSRLAMLGFVAAVVSYVTTGNFGFVQHLQQDIADIRVCFFNFIKQQNSKGVFADDRGEPSSFASRVADFL